MSKNKFRFLFQAYVGCGLGISQIGFVMTSFGVADAICSLVFGPLMKLFGRMPLFVFGAVINMLMIMTLMVGNSVILFFVISKYWREKQLHETKKRFQVGG